MDTFSLFVPNFLPCKEYFVPEKNHACPGCGLALAVRQTYKALEEDIEKAVWQVSQGGDGISILRVKKGKADMTLCFDNEAGGNLSETIRKRMPSDAVAEGVSYVATASPSYPFDLNEKLKKALDGEGRAHIHILCPCPVGWQFEPGLTVKIGRYAVESRAFPLYEVQGGTYRLTVSTPKPRVVAEYLKAQKRFDNLSEKDMEEATKTIENDYRKLTDNVG